jgi:hypothetical protein
MAGVQSIELRVIEQLVEVVDRLTRTIDRLLSHPPTPLATSLRANYPTIAKNQTAKTIDFMAQTITILGTQNTVPGQLTPIAADGVTVEPITTIQPGSEVYTLSPTGIATVAPVTGTEGAFTVTRVSGQSGTVTLMYTAVNTAGTTITNTNGTPDTFVFQGAQTLVASSLAATYGSVS